MLYTSEKVKDKIAKLFISDNFIIIIGFLSILPFIIISIFNNPTADDFCYHCKSRDFGFWNAQISWYNNWSGRYFSNAVLSLKPLISDSFLIYKLIPIILLISFFIAIYYLSSLLFVKLKKRDFFILAFFILTLYLFLMPSIAQGFYWLAGSVTYQLSNILTILFFIFLIKLIETNKKTYLIFSIFFIFLIIGSNETSMLLIDFLISVIFIFKYSQNKKINYSILAIIFFAVIFSLIVIKSPGNTLRASHFLNKYQITDAIFNSVFATYTYSIKWLPFIIISSFIYFDYFNKKMCNSVSKIFNVNPVFLLILICCIPLLGFFPSYWSTGDSPPARTINTIYFYFLIGLIYLTFVLFFKLKKINGNFINFSKWVRYLLFVIILINLMNKNNIRIVYSNLLSGSALEYNLELKNRYKMIQNNKSDTLYVPKLISKPVTIFFDDITNDSKDWRNDCFSRYWNSNPIIIKEK